MLSGGTGRGDVGSRLMRMLTIPRLPRKNIPFPGTHFSPLVRDRVEMMLIPAECKMCSMKLECRDSDGTAVGSTSNATAGIASKEGTCSFISKYCRHKQKILYM